MIVMSERTLTAGAQRAIARARKLVSEWAHAELLPAHLLWSLLLEESEAYELLTGAGLTLDELKLSDIWDGQYPVHLDDGGRSTPANADHETPHTGMGNPADDAETALAEAVTSALAGTLGNPNSASRTSDESRDWQRVLQGARQAAARQKPSGEVSTAHLLTALHEEPTVVSSLLRQYGVESAAGRESSVARDADSRPVAVSFEIDWEADAVDRTATYRILDASANRLREGLRVVEDFVRFVLDDAHLSRLVKSCRHQLRTASEFLNTANLIASRDTQADVGTTIHTDTEMQRATPFDVAIASLKRAQEATRTLEEYSKLLANDRGTAAENEVAQQLGALRYELYMLEKAVVTTVSARQTLAGRRLYLLLTAELCRGNVETTLREVIAGGVDIVQLREKSVADRELLALARRVREITRETDTLLIMNDRPDLAVLCDADGVHVGQDELSVREVRRIAGPNRLVGVSTHSIEQARQAVLDGASYLGVGPVFPSRTKAFDEFAGLDFVRTVHEEISLPWFPIGGIDAANLPQVLQAGAARVAICGAILQARSPHETSRFLADELRAANASRLES
ncbi:thiamine phosphate synthase [bacterium]|nr:thiamine phosphate synthase [bacterium]